MAHSHCTRASRSQAQEFTPLMAKEAVRQEGAFAVARMNRLRTTIQQLNMMTAVAHTMCLVVPIQRLATLTHPRQAMTALVRHWTSVAIAAVTASLMALAIVLET